MKIILQGMVILLAMIGVLAVWGAFVGVSTTYELDNGRLVTFWNDRSKREWARAAIEADDGSTVSTVAPWGERYAVRRVWCGG